MLYRHHVDDSGRSHDICAYTFRVADRMVLLRDHGITEQDVRQRTHLVEHRGWSHVITLQPTARPGLARLAAALLTTVEWLLYGTRDGVAVQEPDPERSRVIQHYCRCTALCCHGQAVCPIHRDETPTD